MTDQRAFPSTVVIHPDDDGMFLRDYFAAAALPEALRIAAGTTHKSPRVTIPPLAADIAYDIADAMMERRST